MTVSKVRRLCDLCLQYIEPGEDHVSKSIGPWDGINDYIGMFRTHNLCQVQMLAIFKHKIVSARDGINSNEFDDALLYLEELIGNENANDIDFLNKHLYQV